MSAYRFWTLTCDGCGQIHDEATPASLAEAKHVATLRGWATGRTRHDNDWCPFCKVKAEAGGPR